MAEYKVHLSGDDLNVIAWIDAGCPDNQGEQYPQWLMENRKHSLRKLCDLGFVADSLGEIVSSMSSEFISIEHYRKSLRLTKAGQTMLVVLRANGAI